MEKFEESRRPDPKVEAEEILPEVEDYLDLRPRKLSEYIGQGQVVETLEIAIQAATRNGGNLLTTSSSILLRDWERRLSPISSLRRWGFVS